MDRYEIEVKEQLDARWLRRFEGFTLSHLPDGRTKLSGELPDQAALHGALTPHPRPGADPVARRADRAPAKWQTHYSQFIGGGTMNTFAKIILGALIALLVLGLIGAAVTVAAVRGVVRTVAVTPERATAIVNEIVDFDLPAGFAGPGAVDVAGLKLVSFTGADGYIMFGQLPAGVRLDPPALAVRLRDAQGDRRTDRSQMTIVGKTPAVIRGQNVALTVAEGTNYDGKRYRELIGVFESKGGQAAVAISGLVSTWNQSAVDAILASLR